MSKKTFAVIMISLSLVSAFGCSRNKQAVQQDSGLKQFEPAQRVEVTPVPSAVTTTRQRSYSK